MTCIDCARRNGCCTYHAVVTDCGADADLQMLAQLIDPEAFRAVAATKHYHDLSNPERRDKFSPWEMLAVREAFAAARRVRVYYG